MGFFSDRAIHCLPYLYQRNHLQWTTTLFTVLEIGNRDMYCSQGTKDFKEAICQSWLIHDLILFQVYCQQSTVLALRDARCGWCLSACVSGEQLSGRKWACMADSIRLPKTISFRIHKSRKGLLKPVSNNSNLKYQDFLSLFKVYGHHGFTSGAWSSVLFSWSWNF